MGPAASGSSLGATRPKHSSKLKTFKMDKEYKNCQSCGMPLKRDEKGGGTNADKSISKKYCSYCYENGEFIYKVDNVLEFQEYCKHKMMEGGHSRFFSWLFTRGMKRLDRWKS
jgi:hypothetical protein